MSASLAAADDLSSIEIDTDGQEVTEELPLSDVAQNDASSPTRLNRNHKRAALLAALLVALVAIIGISVGASNNNNAANKPSTASIQKQEMKQQPGQPMKGEVKKESKVVGIAEVKAEAPKAAPIKIDAAVKQPAPKKDVNVATPFPTEEGTFTVSTEVSAPPTVGNRENVIESPTWRG